MEFVQIIASLGGIISAISVILAIKTTEKRLKVEKDLNEGLSEYLKKNSEVMVMLKKSISEGKIHMEVDNHLEKYEKILNDIMISMPNDKKEKIYPAINQASEKGRVAYISKIISKAISAAS